MDLALMKYRRQQGHDESQYCCVYFGIISIIAVLDTASIILCPGRFNASSANLTPQ